MHRHRGRHQADELNAFFFSLEAQQRDHLIEHDAQVEVQHFDVELARIDFGKIKDVVDDGQQRLGTLFGRFGVVALLVVQRRHQQQLRHAQDAVHGRADFMAHVGHEHAFGLVGCFRGLTGVAQIGHIHAECHRVPIGRAAIHHAQPAAVGHLELGIALAAAVLRHGLGHPDVFVNRNVGVVTALNTGAHNGFEAGPRHDHVCRARVHLATPVIGVNQPVVFVINHEGFVNGLDGSPQQAFGLLQRIRCTCLVSRTGGFKLVSQLVDGLSHTPQFALQGRQAVTEIGGQHLHTPFNRGHLAGQVRGQHDDQPHTNQHHQAGHQQHRTAHAGQIILHIFKQLVGPHISHHFAASLYGHHGVQDIATHLLATF